MTGTRRTDTLMTLRYFLRLSLWHKRRWETLGATAVTSAARVLQSKAYINFIRAPV